MPLPTVTESNRCTAPAQRAEILSVALILRHISARPAACMVQENLQQSCGAKTTRNTKTGHKYLRLEPNTVPQRLGYAR